MPEITEFMLGTTAQYKFDAKYREWISLIHAATSCNIFSLVASVIPESFEDDRVNGSTCIRFLLFQVISFTSVSLGVFCRTVVSRTQGVFGVPLGFLVAHNTFWLYFCYLFNGNGVLLVSKEMGTRACPSPIGAATVGQPCVVKP